MENWKSVPGYEELYLVSDLGRIMSLYTGDILKPSKDQFGYCRFSASKHKRQKTLRTHRLVGELFIPNPNNLPQLNHKNGNKEDNSKDNLEWVTDSANKKHAYANKLMIGGNEHTKIRKDLPRYKLKVTNFD